MPLAINPIVALPHHHWPMLRYKTTDQVAKNMAPDGPDHDGEGLAQPLNTIHHAPLNQGFLTGGSFCDCQSLLLHLMRTLSFLRMVSCGNFPLWELRRAREKRFSA